MTPFRAIQAALGEKAASGAVREPDRLNEQEKSRLVPLAVGYVKYYAEITPFEKNDRIDQERLAEYPECDRNNVAALFLLRRVLQDALLDYDPRLLRRAIPDPETHALALARTTKAGLCVKLGLTIDGARMDLNAQNQFVLLPAPTQNGPVDVDMNIWITSAREKDYTGGAKLTLVQGILNSGVQSSDPIYLEGRPAKCGTFTGANFWGQMTFQAEAAELRELSAQLCSGRTQVEVNDGNSIFQVLEIQVGQAQPLRIGLEFGPDAEKDQLMGIAREF